MHIKHFPFVLQHMLLSDHGINLANKEERHFMLMVSKNKVYRTESQWLYIFTFQELMISLINCSNVYFHRLQLKLLILATQQGHYT